MDLGLSVACAIPSFWIFFSFGHLFFLTITFFSSSVIIFVKILMCAIFVTSEFKNCYLFIFLCNYLLFYLNYVYFLFVFCCLFCHVFWADVIV